MIRLDTTQGTNKETNNWFQKTLLLSSSALTVAGVLVLTVSSPAQAQVGALDTPTGEVVVGGGASFDRPNAGSLNVIQNSNRLIVNWDSFNIGKKATVNFDQKQGSSSIAVNRVTGGAGDPTKILGRLTANGRIIVLDQNGVMFGKNSVIDVGGLIASTGNLASDRKFMKGNNQFVIQGAGNNKSKKVINKGNITIRNNGLLAFVAPYAANDGVINATLGKVTLAAGQKVTVDLTGDKLISFAVNKKIKAALAENTGTINAEGGVVTLSANAAKQVVDDVINMSGTINARSFKNQNGKIILDGGVNGKVKVSGTLDASAPNAPLPPAAPGFAARNGRSFVGGTIEVGGKNISIEPTALLTVSGADGGGTINIGKGQNVHAANSVNVKAGSQFFANALGAGNGGNINIWSQLRTLFNAFASSTGGVLTGNGGRVEIASAGELGYHGLVDTTAANGNRGMLTLDADAITLAHVRGRKYTTNSYVVNVQKLTEALNLNNVSVLAGKSITAENDMDLRFGAGRKLVAGDLILHAPTLNLRYLTMGQGHLTLDTKTLNLNGLLLSSSGRTLLNKKQFTSTTGLVNILSNRAKIQQGIDLVNAKLNKNAKVRVSQDTYDENLTIDKSLTLEGVSNKAGVSPVLRGKIPNGTVINVTSDNVTIDNIDLRADIFSAPKPPPAPPAPPTPPAPPAPHPTLDDGRGPAPAPAPFPAPAPQPPKVVYSQNGIYASNVKGLTVKNNNFAGFENGVTAIKSSNVDVISNVFRSDVQNSYGVKIVGGKNHSVIDNHINDIRNAIFINKVNGLTRVNKNTVHNADKAIEVNGAKKVNIFNNTMTSIQQGINAFNITKKLQVVGNHLNETSGKKAKKQKTGSTGINIVNAQDALVKDNRVNNFFKFGVSLEKSPSAVLKGNIVRDISQGNGYNISSSAGSKLNKNEAHSVGGDGFFVTDSANSYLQENTARTTGGNGFSIVNSNGVTAYLNTVYDAGYYKGGKIVVLQQNFDGHGFYIQGSTNVDIIENDVFGARGDGIHVTSFGGDLKKGKLKKGKRFSKKNDVRILRNDIYNAGDDGIETNNVDNLKIRRNGIFDAYDNGIEVNGGEKIRIKHNRVIAPSMNGIKVSHAEDILIHNNKVITPRKKKGGKGEPLFAAKHRYGTHYGIFVQNSDDVVITDNKVKRFDTGIALDGVSDTFVGGNTLKKNKNYGLHAQGPWNGDITLSDNIFDNNNIGALFNSGLITLSGVNSFVDGRTGMVFSPFFFDDRKVARILHDGPQSFDEGPQSKLELVGNTFGQTVFSGQSENYIVLQNGALFAPGTPTILNAVGATFDGVSGASLTRAELNQIESMLVDFDDNNTLGQIFPGFVPDDIQQEDVLRQILGLLGFTSGEASVIITGLPTIPGLSGSVAALLNAISPAAGGDDPESLNALNPAAGGDNDNTAACWGEVGNAISGGTGSVTFNLGGDTSKILSDLASCGSA